MVKTDRVVVVVVDIVAVVVVVVVVEVVEGRQPHFRSSTILGKKVLHTRPSVPSDLKKYQKY